MGMTGNRVQKMDEEKELAEAKKNVASLESISITDLFPHFLTSKVHPSIRPVEPAA